MSLYYITLILMKLLSKATYNHLCNIIKHYMLEQLEQNQSISVSDFMIWKLWDPHDPHFKTYT